MAQQGWFSRNFGWIGDDFGRAIEQLKKPETWVFIGLLTIFGGLIYFGYRLARKTDSFLRFIRAETASCVEMTNGPIIFLFFGTLFFALAMTVTLGELSQHFDYKRRQAQYQARRSLIQASIWGAVSLVVGAALLIYLDSRCLT